MSKMSVTHDLEGCGGGVGEGAPGRAGVGVQGLSGSTASLYCLFFTEQGETRIQGGHGHKPDVPTEKILTYPDNMLHMHFVNASEYKDVNYSENMRQPHTVV